LQVAIDEAQIMARYRNNRLVGEIISRDVTAGLPLFAQAVAATAPRKIATGDGTRDASYAATIEGGTTESQKKVLNAIRELRIASDREISGHLRIGVNRVTGRRTELQELGLVADAGTKYDGETHRHVMLWRLR
jgi:hypothetical protein